MPCDKFIMDSRGNTSLERKIELTMLEVNNKKYLINKELLKELENNPGKGLLRICSEEKDILCGVIGKEKKKERRIKYFIRNIWNREGRGKKKKGYMVITGEVDAKERKYVARMIIENYNP